VLPLDLGHSSSFVPYRSQTPPVKLYNVFPLHFTFHIHNPDNFFLIFSNPIGKVIRYAPETMESGFDSQQQAKDFTFSEESRSVLGRTQPSTEIETGVKQPKREADHSRPSSAEEKNVCSYSLLPVMSSWCGKT
jgi:hypothetical protein